MMKILLIFSLSLISGPVGCAVTGYLGGSVIIISEQRWISTYSRYICKKELILCSDIIRSRTLSENSAQVGRFWIYKNREGFLTVLIRSLKLQDAGEYRIGTWGYNDVNLKVVNDSCCTEPKTVSAFPGQNINIILNYPVLNEREIKYLVKLDGRSVIKHVLNTSKQSRNSKIYVTDDKSAKVLSMNIGNVREPDAGVYLVGVYSRINLVQYYSFFTEIQLNVTAEKEIPPVATHFNSSSIINISVSVCGVLLLTVGCALLVYKLKHRRTEAPTPSAKDNEQSQVPPTDCVYEEINQTKHASASNTELYMNASLPTNSADKEVLATVPDQNLTYTTLSFQKNDAAVTFSKEESMTEYATVQQPKTEIM